MYFREKTSDGRAYLQIVESRREGAAVRQQVIATLGRIDELQASGQLERLLRSGARFADKAIVLDALNRGEATVVATRRIGPQSHIWSHTSTRFVARSVRHRKTGTVAFHCNYCNNPYVHGRRRTWNWRRSWAPLQSTTQRKSCSTNSGA